MASLEDIFLALGRVQEGVEQLRDDFKEEKRSAHESRTSIHRRLDEHATEIASLRTDVTIAGKIEAQVRNELKALNEKVDPSLEDWKRMKSLGIGIAGLLAVGGLSFGAFLMWAGDAAVTAVRHWLRIT
ncbi:DUF1515 domain-containing protein [Mesorhizobium waimense]|uniref:DUF1515 domain-containing protein n=1 Tax=Mesorhizobium waimense TaxID=1300307 RepID=A0A3A5KYR9_9HYPH|nr:DUF1515 family protein [Mesorhizobium waimense]RJT42015.1 DUF1515 domain-containing protein [Mesorhizobium waimense]